MYLNRKDKMFKCLNDYLKPKHSLSITKSIVATEAKRLLSDCQPAFSNFHCMFILVYTA